MDRREIESRLQELSRQLHRMFHAGMVGTPQRAVIEVEYWNLYKRFCEMRGTKPAVDPDKMLRMARADLA